MPLSDVDVRLGRAPRKGTEQAWVLESRTDRAAHAAVIDVATNHEAALNSGCHDRYAATLADVSATGPDRLSHPPGVADVTNFPTSSTG